MPEIVTIYCEGRTGSHDHDILSKVFDGLSVMIEPIGGKRGTNAIIEFNEKYKKTAQSDFYLFFRDRDFDCPIPDKEELTFDGNKTYFSYKTTIENYLFDVLVFYHFLEKEGLKEKYNIKNMNDVRILFINSAKEIKNYQAVRHSLGEMRTGNASFGTTWMMASGTLPSDLSLENCKTEGFNLIKSAVHETQTWNLDSFNEKVQYFVNLMDEHFFESLNFLNWFQGKDFAKALANQLPEISFKKYYRYAKECFGDYSIPQSESNHLFLDLIELRSLVISKAHKVK